jgi:hypothetical protein
VLAGFLCICLVAAAVGFSLIPPLISRVFYTPTDEGEAQRPDGADVPPTDAVEPHVERSPVPEDVRQTEDLIRDTDVPERDLIAITERLKGISEVPVVVREQPRLYQVGDQETFWVSNPDRQENRQIDATLRYVTPHVYMWVENGLNVSDRDLQRAADNFEQNTYPTDREFFGSEWTPGVDSDPHLFILHASDLGESLAGYYSSADEFSQLVHPYSNEKEMFYLNIDPRLPSPLRVNSDFYNGVLAHEFQHMIHWYNDANEETWMNEGLSELASFLNGYDVGGFDIAFSREPDTQLNTWPEGPGSATANYGAAYLFTSYFLDRFGPEATRTLIADTENGLASVDNTLRQLRLKHPDTGADLTAEDVFADWVVANVLDDENVADGRYGNARIRIPEFDIGERHSNYPVQPKQRTVHQYATDYIALRGRGSLIINFSGSTTIKLLDNDPHSGRYQWWSNRSDESDMTLTREFDLSGASSATLRFWTWYLLEENWDYAYVEVSTNNGETWEILRTPDSTDANPNGNSYGWGWTGASGGGDSPRWIEQEVDLSDYTGQKVLVRFEYITDAAVNLSGFAVDDIRIPEIGFEDDGESGDNGWQAAGFVRNNNTLPQRFIVQLIEHGRDTRVRRLELNDDQTGAWDIELGGDVRDAILVISAIAPVTTEVASYEYSITER